MAQVSASIAASLGWVPASARAVVWSAFRAGAWGARWRPSQHAFSGAVTVIVFSSQPAAAAFARRWAGRVGVFCALRQLAGLAAWSVSVPVAGLPCPGSFLAAGSILRFSGRGAGVRGAAWALATATTAA